MVECIGFINQKGGVGKTTLCQNFGASLANKGFKVLIIDLDPQGNLTYSLNSENGKFTETLLQRGNLEELIVKGETFDLIPSDLGLATLDIYLTEVGKEFRLKEALEKIKQNYDYILLDTPPSLGILTINALTAADSLIIPAQPDIYSLQGIGQLYQTVQSIKTYCNPNLLIKGIVLNRFNSRTVIGQDIKKLLENTAQQMDTRLFKTKVRECTALKEAAALRKNIFEYNQKSNASQDLNLLVEEVLNE